MEKGIRTFTARMPYSMIDDDDKLTTKMRRRRKSMVFAHFPLSTLPSRSPLFHHNSYECYCGIGPQNGRL